jgi:hypothetical protein
LEAVEFLSGSTVLAFGLGLVTEEKRKGVGAAGEAVKAGGDAEGVPLPLGDFDVFHKLRVDEDGLAGFGRDGFLKTRGEESGFETGGAEDG